MCHFLPQVKFDSDTIDETDRLEEALKPRVEFIGGKLEKVVLRGTHITPCIQVLLLSHNSFPYKWTPIVTTVDEMDHFYV